MVIGESGTMSSEAAVLGTPAVMFAPRGAGVFDDQERYGLLRRIRSYSVADALEAIDTVLADPDRLLEGRTRMLGDKISLTPWMTDFLLQRGWERSAAFSPDT